MTTVIWIQGSQRLDLLSVQSLSHIWLFVTPWTSAHQASLCILPEPTQTHVHCVSDAIQPSHPLSFPSPPTFNLRVFSNESGLHIRWPKYWSFSFNISLSSEYSGLISFRMDWLDLLAVQGLGGYKEIYAYSLITGMTSYTFCRTLFVRS